MSVMNLGGLLVFLSPMITDFMHIILKMRVRRDVDHMLRSIFSIYTQSGPEVS